MNKLHIEKNTVQETLVIPLYSRKVCNERFGDFFSDQRAVSLMERLDYDFKEVAEQTKSKIQQFGALEVGARQKSFMFEVSNYLKDHPCASIINLGCGLDESAERLDNGKCKIYNLDFPDVIEVRNKLIPAGNRVTNIACNLNDLSWMEKIDKDNGAAFFASGVFYYFTKDEIKHLINGMASYFKGGFVVFDLAGKTASKVAIKTWIKMAKIKGIGEMFYIGNIKKDVMPWLKNAKVSAKPYMNGYFNLKEYKSIPASFRFLSKIADNMMKMKIIKIEFDK